MTESSDRLLFDEIERKLIRNTLLHYKRTHGIGTPKLAKRIHNAQPLGQKIPLSTLQRFLASRGRTYDSYVAMFSRFTEGLPCPDPVGSLGKAMAEFYGLKSVDKFLGFYSLTVSYEMNPTRDPLKSTLV